MALYEMEDAKERVILVGVQENDAEPEEESLDEPETRGDASGDVYPERKDPGAEGTFVGDRRYGNHL